MTTNAGAEAIKNESAFGFQKPDDDASYENMKERVRERIERVFRPEFLNRLDDTIIFHHLTDKDMHQVIDLELAKVRERLEERGYQLELTGDSKEFLIRKGTDLDYGARPLRRAIENFVEDPLSEEILRGEFQGMDTIIVDGVKNDKGKVTRVELRGEKRQADPPSEPVGAASGEAGTGEEPSDG